MGSKSVDFLKQSARIVTNDRQAGYATDTCVAIESLAQNDTLRLTMADEKYTKFC